VVFAGRLASLDPWDARAIAERLGATVADELSDTTTLVIEGAAAADAVLRRARQANEAAPGRVRFLDEDRFCDLAGVPSPSALRRQFHPASDLRERYRHVREDHLRYMEKWGLIRPAHRSPGETYYGFPDLAVVREADAALAEGASFRTVLKSLVAARSAAIRCSWRRRCPPRFGRRCSIATAAGSSSACTSTTRFDSSAAGWNDCAAICPRRCF
jgi:hypothetical protein